MIARKTGATQKSRLGQYLTPARTAKFMAGLFPDTGGHCRLLYPGAGIGSLAAAFLDRWRSGELRFESVSVDAFEIDPALHLHLVQTLDQYRDLRGFASHVSATDFIHAASDSVSRGLFASAEQKYTHAILNPPYKKIHSASAHRSVLRGVGIEAVNLYAAFVALAIAQCEAGGQVVAIIPRSFCNGPYYRPFRAMILERCAIRHMHLFGSRNTAFKDDGVLQENIIVRLECGGRQGGVTVTTSTDDSFSDLVETVYPFEQIVFTEDAERFIHVPTHMEQNLICRCTAISYTPADLGVSISTGPVVDFRLKQHLRAMPAPATAPLLYPAHFSGGRLNWPIESFKKSNAIDRNAQTERWLYPNGYYCVVRRFSAKEEKRRIVASVIEPDTLGDAEVVGIENHLNVFHHEKRGLPEALARGLAVFLNSTAVDDSFRRFNGHTQVNATDLRSMAYPSRGTLVELGRWAMGRKAITQKDIDARVGGLLA